MGEHYKFYVLSFCIMMKSLTTDIFSLPCFHPQRWVSTTVPNERELEVYKRTSEVEGIIVICLKICPLNKCPDVYGK